MSNPESFSAAVANLPPAWPGVTLAGIRRELQSCRIRVVVLDDDPTGTQTVKAVRVVTRWDVETLRGELASERPGFFVLTNSRSLSVEATTPLHKEIAANIAEAAGDIPVTVISRSDSTLRGHFPAETDAIAEILGQPDIVVLAPYFEAGGRVTLDDHHYVLEGDDLVPAAETPFARDAAFGYRSSHLPTWVSEKSGGRIEPRQVKSVSVSLLRLGGPDAVERFLRELPHGCTCLVNACSRSDIEVFAAGAFAAERSGLRILYRTAASFVAARLGQSPPRLLEGSDVVGTGRQGGLVIAGSYVPKTTAQLDHLRKHHDLECIELPVESLLAPDRNSVRIDGLVAQADAAVARGRDTLVFTSRRLITGETPAASLAIGACVSNALVTFVSRLTHQPRFLVAKGGITSSDIATRGLGVQRATVLGQLLPGVPVWNLGPETRFPNLPYVVFPGNVGGESALTEALTKLKSTP